MLAQILFLVGIDQTSNQVKKLLCLTSNYVCSRTNKIRPEQFSWIFVDSFRIRDFYM